MSSRLALPTLPVLRPRARLWVALSGGLDSTVLLHSLAQIRPPNLRAVHVNHGLQASAADWARHCRRLCRKLGVPLRVLTVQVLNDHPEGPEAAAREARYEALSSVMGEGDLVATAHHRDDQAETVLLRLLRGSGPAGLAGMRALRPLGPGQLWRPLLDLPRETLRRYAEAEGLEWIEDPHNLEPRYTRSFLRQQVWPLLEQRWPQAGASIARAAQHLAETADLLAALAAQDLAAQDVADGSLSIAGLMQWPAPRRRNLLRHWIVQRGFAAPAAAALERLQAEVLEAKADARPLLNLGDAEVRRYRDRLFLMAPLPPAPAGDLELAWTRSRALELPPGCGRLSAPRAPPQPLTIRFACGGERLKPACGGPTRTLKNLFQERGVPPWVRERTPLVYAGGELAAVGDYFFSVPFAGWAWPLRWERPAPSAPAASRG
ncbi:MAG TPA: tRNA lysidine(34) synthetase TilS [Solimonas sp.]|nr:tRNA lysidine(34) synthetase TilS [Solimonas sp.]